MEPLCSTFDVGHVVLDRLVAKFAERGRSFGVTTVVSGDVVLDDCCVGVLLVRPGRSFEVVDPFPSQPAPGSRQPKYIAVEMSVYLASCIEVINEDGSAPAPAKVAVKTRSLLEDAATIWNAFTTPGGLGLTEYDEPIFEVAYVEQEPQPNSGQCAAVEIRATVGVPCHIWCGE